MRTKTMVVGAFGLLLAGSVLAADWRLELLEREGIGITPDALRKVVEGIDTHQIDFRQAYERLGAEEFPVREAAQRDFQNGGDSARRWLKKQPDSDDPEIRARVGTIFESMDTASGDVREMARSHAIRSLFAEAGKAPDKATGGLFYEGFSGSLKAPEKTYRRFEVEAGDGMSVGVNDGRLVMAGDRPGDDNQRLVLRAAQWPGVETMPDHFQVSATLGGTGGDAGAWHLGLAVGRVRALFHPGIEGGSFRFEQVDSRQQLTPTENMGFTPPLREMQRMSLDVRRMEDGSVILEARVTSKNGKIFKRICEIASETIGPLDQVSLDRSGRTGGDAIFDDLMIEVK